MMTRMTVMTRSETLPTLYLSPPSPSVILSLHSFYCNKTSYCIEIWIKCCWYKTFMTSWEVDKQNEAFIRVIIFIIFDLGYYIVHTKLWYCVGGINIHNFLTLGKHLLYFMFVTILPSSVHSHIYLLVLLCLQFSKLFDQFIINYCSQNPQHEILIRVQSSNTHAW